MVVVEYVANTVSGCYALVLVTRTESDAGEC
jgi:hypothetical protein